MERLQNKDLWVEESAISITEILTTYALFSVIGYASITQAIFQCKKATPFN